MPVGSDLKRLRNELDTARLHLAAAVGARDAWETGAQSPNDDLVIRAVAGAERSVGQAQRLVLRLLDRQARWAMPVLGASPTRRIVERWRDRLAREHEDRAQPTVDGLPREARDVTRRVGSLQQRLASAEERLRARRGPAP